MRSTIKLNYFLLYILFILLLQSCASLNLPESQRHKKGKNDNFYISQVKKITTNLEEHGFMQSSMVLAAVAVEPLNSLAAGLRIARGNKEHFNEYHANPSTLTKIQAKKRPILLLHGDKHNQSAFIPMLSYFRKNRYDGPIFTLNLPSTPNESLRHSILDQKLEKIDSLYSVQGIKPIPKEKHLRTLIIGHSWGADEAIDLEKRDKTVRPLILIGSLKHSQRKKPQIYINAVSDVILNLPSQVMDNITPIGEVIYIKTGHLGLLSHPEVLKKCYKTAISLEKFS